MCQRKDTKVVYYKITDIAFKYGYETPESFTKAFTRFHGIAPKFAREESAKLLLFNPLVIKITVEGGKSMDYRIVQTKEQKFISLFGIVYPLKKRRKL